MKATLAKTIASTLQAIRSCEKSGNKEWLDRHSARLDALARYLPSGSGFDNGTQIDAAHCTRSKLVFETSFHHMTEGVYTHWTDHTVAVRATFLGFDITVSGEGGKGDHGHYVAEEFYHLLSTEYEQTTSQGEGTEPATPEGKELEEGDDNADD